jgi:hypothetical protein
MTEATSPKPIPPIRLREPRDVLGVVPTMLGFHPEQSVVLLCLGGARRQVRITMRADLPADPSAAAMRELTDRAAQAGTEAIVAAIYSEAAPAPGTPGELPHRDLVQQLRSVCAAESIELLEVLLVGRGRWWSYLCRDTACCPPEGTALPTEVGPEVVRYRAESVARGSLIWPRRSDLEASIAAPGEESRQATAAVFDAVEAEFVHRLAAGDAESLRTETVHLFHDVHVRYRDGGGALEVETAARLAWGLHDIRTRDEIIGWSGGAQPGAFLALLADLVRTVPPPQDAPACTVLAWAAYRSGDGALAQCALDRATASDPAYNLALLLQHALDRAVNPARLADVFTAAIAASRSDTG